MSFGATYVISELQLIWKYIKPKYDLYQLKIRYIDKEYRLLMQWKCKKIQKTENIQTYTMTYIDWLIFSGVFLLIGQCTCLDWNTKIILSFEHKSIFIVIFVTIKAIVLYDIIKIYSSRLRPCQQMRSKSHLI